MLLFLYLMRKIENTNCNLFFVLQIQKFGVWNVNVCLMEPSLTHGRCCQSLPAYQLTGA